MELTLPSGATVEVQRPNLVRMAAASADNEIPRFLTSLVMAEVHNLPDEVTHAPLRKKHLERLSRFMDAVIIGCVLWPRIVRSNPDYDNGEIMLADLTASDREYLFTWAMPADLDAVTAFVRNKPALWELYRVGEKYGTRPSELVGITDVWLAWDFDHAVTMLGMHIENEINEPSSKDQREAQAKATRKVNSILGIKKTGVITSVEDAIAAGFILTPPMKKDTA